MKVKYITLRSPRFNHAEDYCFRAITGPSINEYGAGITEEEALMDLRIKIAGFDAEETVELENMDHVRY